RHSFSQVLGSQVATIAFNPTLVPFQPTLSRAQIARHLPQRRTHGPNAQYETHGYQCPDKSFVLTADQFHRRRGSRSRDRLPPGIWKAGRFFLATPRYRRLSEFDPLA